MKWILTSVLFISSVSFAQKIPVVHAPCLDMGGENGWGQWQWQISTNNYNNTDSIIWSTPMSNPASPRFALNSGAGNVLCTPGPPPFSPSVPLVAPDGFGNVSIQIGQDTTANWTSEKLTYVLTVGQGDTNFVLSYALLIQDPGHIATQQPFIELSAKDQNGNIIPCGYFKI